MSSEEIKEILEKQLQRLSEASEKTNVPGDLSALSSSMIAVIDCLSFFDSAE